MNEAAAIRAKHQWAWLVAVMAIVVSTIMIAAIRPNRHAVAKPYRATRDESGWSGAIKDDAHAAKSITLAKPKRQVFDFLCNPPNWPDVIKGLPTVEALGEQRSRLYVGKARSVVDIKITGSRSLGQIAWQSDGGSQMDIQGSINLRDTRSGQGTDVVADLA